MLLLDQNNPHPTPVRIDKSNIITHGEIPYCGFRNRSASGKAFSGSGIAFSADLKIVGIRLVLPQAGHEKGLPTSLVASDSVICTERPQLQLSLGITSTLFPSQSADWAQTQTFTLSPLPSSVERDL